MTGVLARQALEAVAIVAVTTAAFAAGRADDRSVLPRRPPRRVRSSLAVAVALGAVAVVAAVAVVVVFGGVHRDAAVPSRPTSQPMRSRSPARPSSSAQFAQQ